MTLSIEVPQELASRLQQAGIEVDDAGRYAIEALSEAADHAEVRAWWDLLGEEQQAKRDRAHRRKSRPTERGRLQSGRTRSSSRGYAH